MAIRAPSILTEIITRTRSILSEFPVKLVMKRRLKF